MKNYSICLFTKNFRGGQLKEYVLVEKPEAKSLDAFGAFTNHIREELASWGETTDGGGEDGYSLTCEDIDVDLTPEIMTLLTNKLINQRGLLDKRMEENTSRINFLSDLSKEVDAKNNNLKIVECPVCLGWRRYPASNHRRAGLLCERCKGEGQIAVEANSTIPDWNIGGAHDMSHGT